LHQHQPTLSHRTRLSVGRGLYDRPRSSVTMLELTRTPLLLVDAWNSAPSVPTRQSPSQRPALSPFFGLLQLRSAVTLLVLAIGNVDVAGCWLVVAAEIIYPTCDFCFNRWLPKR